MPYVSLIDFRELFETFETLSEDAPSGGLFEERSIEMKNLNFFGES